MSDPPPEPADLDALLRDRLDRAAEGIDPRPLFDRITGSVSGPLAPRAAPAAPLAERADYIPGRSRLARAGQWAAGLATAAAVAYLFLGGGGHVRPVTASPEQIVRQAQETHQQPLDRCYLVEFRPESDLFEDSRPLAAQFRTSRLWTRGDRFWIESSAAAGRGAWGRDERGEMWLAFPGLRRGVRLGPDETPRWLEAACDTYSMRVDTLLSDVLRDFDLTREPSGADVQVVAAALKPNRRHPGLGGARLEIDPETKAVRKLVLNRTRMGKPVATVTYTLVETGVQDDGKYLLEGHLPAKSEVFTRDHEPQRRAELLARWFGPIARPGFLPPPPKK